MKTTGSILALIGGILVILAGIGTLFVHGMNEVWRVEYSAATGFVSIGTILSLVIIILAFISLSFQPKIAGVAILVAAFAGIIFGGTFIDICMIFSIIGGFLLFTLPDKKPEGEKAGAPISRHWWFWALIGLLSLAILWGLYTVLNPLINPPAPADTTAVAAIVAEPKVPGSEAISTTPDELLDQYNKNGYAADERFKNKLVRLTGEIYDIKSLPEGGSAVIFKSLNKISEELEKETVQCNFGSAETASQTAKYKVGDRVTVAGIVQGTGGKLDDIVIVNCSVETP